MTSLEQTIWAAVFAAELFKSRDAYEGFPIDKAAKAADFAVSDLARYRRTKPEREAVTPVDTAALTVADAKAVMDDAELERLTRPAKATGKASRS